MRMQTEVSLYLSRESYLSEPIAPFRPAMDDYGFTREAGAMRPAQRSVSPIKKRIDVFGEKRIEL